jgi:carbonic anhydrase/acetyltransferase-like protein (isoleucine patch superfamily)
MLIEHAGKRPRVHESAYVAPNAVLSGDVTVGPGARILFGAVVTAEGASGQVVLGRDCIVMENAVVRGRPGRPCRVGDSVLIGPHAHLNGCEIGDSVFVATGASVFPGARVGERSELRINAVVHVNTVVGNGQTLPIGWVAVGNPAQTFPPDRHEEIWAIQKELGFPREAFGIERPSHGESIMPEAMRIYSERFGAHLDDTVIDP